jgi:O-antigen/teichoic acid export membrane protein
MGISSNLFYQHTTRTNLQLAVVSFAAGCSLILNYMFVPIFGIYGAAYVNVASMAVLTLMHYQFSRSCYFIDIHWNKLLLLIGCAIFIIWFIQITIEVNIYSLQIKLLFMLIALILAIISIYKKMKLQRWG